MTAILLGQVAQVRSAINWLDTRRVRIERVILNPHLPNPIIEVQQAPLGGDLAWHRYAWGVDDRGPFVRYQTRVNACLVICEQRGRTPRRQAA